MKQQTKFVLWTVGVVATTFAAYKAYKYYKEQEKLEEQALDINDIRAYAEAKRADELVEARKAKLEAGIEDEDTEDDGGWYTNSNGVLERELTREEFLYGADYDMLTEELIEYTTSEGQIQ